MKKSLFLIDGRDSIVLIERKKIDRKYIFTKREKRNNFFKG
jgi:hypothetical protein